MRFHVLGLPHTATNKLYSACAFTQKVLKICQMLKMLGHTVYHYGNELSHVECDEHIDITKRDEIMPPDLAGKYDTASKLYGDFNERVIVELAKRKQKSDFVLCFFPTYQPVFAAHGGDLFFVEAGVGYPGGFFAPYKVFESYAMLHAFRGTHAVGVANGNTWWYDAVIPNSYDPDDFTFRRQKDNYFLFMGQRVIGAEGKGIGIAVELAERTKHRLVVAGPGKLNEQVASSKAVHAIGWITGADRARWLARAKALLAPSLFVEPFCGVAIEAMLSGTPVISTDWGALTEHNLHGVTGYRCRTMEQFEWAAAHIGGIDPCDCRAWAMNFSLESVAPMYEEYFRAVHALSGQDGWYHPQPDRRQLDWLSRRYPPGVQQWPTNQEKTSLPAPPA